jgi:hypothetical protein
LIGVKLSLPTMVFLYVAIPSIGFLHGMAREIHYHW